MSDRSPDSPVGLVLSGGGALGAYEAGVWKAFCECGVANRVRAISGTSVGVINGAAFALLHDPEEMRNLWVNRVREILTPNFKLFDRGKIAGTIGNAFHGRQAFPFLGIFSREGLSAILRDVIARPVAETGIDVYATALQCKGSIWRTFDPTAYCLRRFHLNEERPVERMRQIIMASAAVPWGFDPVEIDGERYVDGGFEANGGDNVPIAPILDNHPEIKTVYVVRFESRRTEPNVKTVHSESGRKIIEIRPRDPLPGVLDGWNFANNPIANTPVIQRAAHGIVAKFPIYSGAISFLPEFSEKYFDTGYADGMAVLRDSQLQQEFIWRNKTMTEDKQASASTQKQGQDIAPTQSLRMTWST